MRRLAIPMVFAPVLIVGCAARAKRTETNEGTLAALRNVQPDKQDVKVEQGLDQAMEQYRRFLKDAPETAMTPEAMRRLADLQIEKQFGVRASDAKLRKMPAPERAPALAGSLIGRPNTVAAASTSGLRESGHDCERRPTEDSAIMTGDDVLSA